jgi:hypothetical protein
MVNPVMAGCVEDVLQWSQMVHQLCVEPELKNLCKMGGEIFPIIIHNQPIGVGSYDCLHITKRTLLSLLSSYLAPPVYHSTCLTFF